MELIARESTTTTDAGADVTSPPPDGNGGGVADAVVDTWVIASDSTYIVMGATDLAWKRRAAGWKKGKKKPPNVVEKMESSDELALSEGLVLNADLWDRLLKGIMNVRGQVLFWQIESKWNLAHDLAYRGAVRKKFIFIYIHFFSPFPFPSSTVVGVD